MTATAEDLESLLDDLWTSDQAAWARLDEIAETVTAMAQRDPEYAHLIDADNLLTDAGASYTLGLYHVAD